MQTYFNAIFIALIAGLIVALPVSANQDITDPLDSPAWQIVHDRILSGEDVVFDERVIVRVPDFAEDAMNVPVTVQVDGIDNIEDIVVFADLNPIRRVLSFQPIAIKPYLSFRIKVEQSTPVRAAVKTKDGTWYVGGRWLDAAGGGCTAPSVGRAADNWHETLMDVSARSWKDQGQLSRLRFRIMHPMDTGLAPGIPEFYIERFSVRDSEGQVLAHLNVWQPVSENPVFTFDLATGTNTQAVQIVGRDNNGNELSTLIQ